MTTVDVKDDVKGKLDDRKIHENESYNDVIDRVIENNSPEFRDAPDVEQIIEGLENSMDKISMANDQTTDMDVSGIMAEIKKAQELAEQARDNTEDLKAGLR
ncbi:antitoxin VapB family protein [Natrialba taiwanensis]|uniref:Uncharacterized protein n=1 Tax=Natrialba taiwanensis DSM 12281 TaxID=1230458 RepID=L9ZY64_9EURY|nr:antitoxin VapB family protein [Natrialba taiwanensis]ELY91450.1 hypothetical protein C484_10496 [Natrialba taiwanensis DSM 12281]